MRNKILSALIVATAFCISCAAKNPGNFDRSEDYTPTVTVAEDSDPVPDWLIPHVIKRTDLFCKESGRPGVKEIGIHWNAAKHHANVVYICLTDPVLIQDIAISDVPVRVTDEEMGDVEVSYLSSKAVYCLYIDPDHCSLSGVRDE